MAQESVCHEKWSKNSLGYSRCREFRAFFEGCHGEKIDVEFHIQIAKMPS